MRPREDSPADRGYFPLVFSLPSCAKEGLFSTKGIEIVLPSGCSGLEMIASRQNEIQIVDTLESTHL
jgi:hypothetical protein